MRGVDPQRNRRRETTLTVFHVKRSSTSSRLLFSCVILTATQHEPRAPPGHGCRARVVHGSAPELGFIRDPCARPPHPTSGCTSPTSAAGAPATTAACHCAALSGPLLLGLDTEFRANSGGFCRSYWGRPLPGQRIPAQSIPPMPCHISALATGLRAGLRKSTHWDRQTITSLLGRPSDCFRQAVALRH